MVPFRTAVALALLLAGAPGAFAAARPDAHAGKWEQLMAEARDAISHYSLGDAEEPLLAAVKEAEAFPKGDPRLLESLTALAGLYTTNDRLEDAEPVLKRALAATEQLKRGPAAVGLACYSVGDVCLSRREYADAEKYLKRAQALLEKARGKQHPDLLPVLTRRAAALRALKREPEAKALEARAAAIRAAGKK